MLNIPKKIKVGAIEYDIEIVPFPDESDCQVDGKIYYHLQKIKIKDYGLTDYLQEVFLHELVHAIFEHMQIEQSEVPVTKISKALHMIIKDNPDIFK